MRLVLGVLASVCLLSAANAARAQDKPTFVFTGIPDQDETRLAERFAKVADYLQAKLGVPVRYVPVKSYPAAVTAFTNNQVQLAWFGGFTGVQARRAVPGSEAIAQGARMSRSRAISSLIPRRGSLLRRRSRRTSRGRRSHSALAHRRPAE